MNKSPSPDGYESGFFKASWSVVGQDICEAVLEFMRNGKMLKQLNATLIYLIPKVSNPTNASQFRPISCCNVLYKYISKLLCTRLSTVLPYLVSDNQATFVKGRSLVHNVLMCHDLLRHYNRKTSPKCLMKIDLRKSNDMVQWDFVQEMLEGYGFPPKFIQLVMTCVTTTSFFVKVNGESCGYFEGLTANSEKSSIYMAGMDDEMKEKLLTLTGFSLGSFSMKYLGLPLSPKK
ncbi:uncharacterized protein LOC132609887 [Lycium barbarum]|uniref:uncharacterized protein LOC132609887 n=1 Tax=Lycium barbarum TaxID=112863 RepID=UPI00293E8CB7|nr:uncharacterized protein LOC132609887 [Lycium barbarum]